MIPVAIEALQVWLWLQFRLPPDVWFEAQRILSPAMPTPTNPQLAQGLAAILDSRTLPAVRLQLLEQLLLTIKNGGLNTTP